MEPQEGGQDLSQVRGRDNSREEKAELGETRLTVREEEMESLELRDERLERIQQCSHPATAALSWVTLSLSNRN